MPNLKCFGGPNDGEVWRFDHNQKEIALRKDEPGQTRGFSAGLTSDTISFRQTLYTRRKVQLDKHSIVEFLAPQDWDDERALRWALEP